MTALFLTFVGLLILRVAWGAWKSTCRDVARDKLFDLRDEWREFFVSNGLSMELPEYAKVRGMINDYLRYTARFRLVGLVYTAFAAPRELYIEAAERIEEEFRSPDAKIAAQINRIRAKAVSAVQEYMLCTSMLLFPVFAIALCVGVFVGTGKLIARAKSFLKQLADDSRYLSPGMIEMSVAP